MDAVAVVGTVGPVMQTELFAAAGEQCSAGDPGACLDPASGNYAPALPEDGELEILLPTADADALPGMDLAPPVATPERFRGPVSHIAEVLVDGSGRVGLLSYLVPEGMHAHLGDEVLVPFGKSDRHGVVLALAEATAYARRSSKATRPVAAVLGQRMTTADVAVVRALAELHMCPLEAIGPRLAPKSGRASDPLDAGPVRLAAEFDVAVERLPASVLRRLYVRAPGLDPARLAAWEAQRIGVERAGQVLVLCPTTALVEQVVAVFASGAARLDAQAPEGAWRGFATGSVAVGVGTRSAALYAPARLAGIVVVEEDAYGHLEQVQPAWNARDVAVARARAARCALTLVSAAPSPEAMGAVERGVQAGSASTWPSLAVVDRAAADPASRAVPPGLVRILAQAVKAGRTPVVVASSAASVRRCAGCSVLRPCTQCDTALACRHPAEPCDCGSSRTRLSGWDRARVRAAVGRDDVQVVGPGDLDKVRQAGCVVLFDVDAAFGRADLLGEYAGWRQMAAAGTAAGPGGQVVVVTSDAAHPWFAAWRGRDGLTAARAAWESARAAALPPFGRLVRIRCGQDTRPRTTGWPGLVAGPTRVGSEWQILVRCAASDWPALSRAVSRLRRGGKVRLQVS